MSETVSTLDALRNAREAEAKARTDALARIEAIQDERRKANDAWSAEIEALKNSLRVRAAKPRKPKLASAPEPTSKKASG